MFLNLLKMDALDLTTGERISGVKFLPKGSRRKAATPQRRQHSDGESNTSVDNADEDKIESSSFDGDGNNDEIVDPPTPPRPSSEGSIRPNDFNHNLSESKELLPANSINLTSMMGDLAKKYLQSREKLAAITAGSSMLPRSRHFPLNANNNSSNSPCGSTDMTGTDSDAPNSEYRTSLGQKDLSLPFLNPTRGFAMDDLMQQRLRRYLDDVQPAEAPGIPERTKKQNRWAFNVWREWARKRNALEDSFIGPYKGVPLDVGQAGEEELDYWLCKFVMEIRRKDGNPYPPHTLMQIVMGIQRYLRQQAGKPTICILDRSNSTYSNFRSVLDYRIKELTNSGAPAMKSGARSQTFGDAGSKYASLVKGEPFPPKSTRTDEESRDWKEGVMNTDTAQGLLNAVFWHNYTTFGIQYIDDHWNLRAEHFQIHGKLDDEEPMVLEFTPSMTSMMANTGKQSSMRVTQKKIYSDSASDKEVFNIYYKYLSNIPKSGPFYRHPVDPTIVDRSIKFSDQWVGKNRLRAMLKHLIDIGGTASRLKSYNLANRHAVLSARNFITPMLQLSSHAADFSHSTPLQGSMDLIKPFLRLQQQQHAKTATKREIDDDSLGENESGPSSPKIAKPRSPETKTPTLSSDPGSNRSSNGVTDDAALEIAVPKTIKSITVLKGGRKITFHLD